MTKFLRCALVVFVLVLLLGLAYESIRTGSATAAPGRPVAFQVQTPTATAGPIATQIHNQPAVTTVTTPTLSLLHNTYRVTLGPSPGFVVYLTAEGADIANVSAAVLGLSGPQGQFWPARFSSVEEVQVGHGHLTTLELRAEPGEPLPPFGTFTANLRLSALNQPTQSLPISLEIVPADRAELLVESPGVVHVSDGSSFIVPISARYAAARNVQGRILRLVNQDGQSVASDLIIVTVRPATIAPDMTGSLEFTFDSQRKNMLSSGVYTTTLLLTAENAPPLVNDLTLDVTNPLAPMPGPVVQWELQASQIRARIDARTAETSFGLLFVNRIDITQPLSTTLVSLARQNGSLVVPGDFMAEQISDACELPPGLSRQYRCYSIKLVPIQQRPLAQGVYTGTLRLESGGATKTVSFTLELPASELFVSAPRQGQGNPHVQISLTRWGIPGLRLLWEQSPSLKAPTPLLITTRDGLGQLRDLTITDAGVTSNAGSGGTVHFNPSSGFVSPLTPTLASQMIVQGIRGMGVFSGSALIRSPDLGTPQTLDLTVNVTDAFVWPLLMIALGVGLASFLARRLDKSQNPEYQTILIEDLRREADLAQTGVSDPPVEVREVEATINTLLKEAERLVRRGDYTEAAQKREQAGKELEKLKLLYDICRTRGKIAAEWPHGPNLSQQIPSRLYHRLLGDDSATGMLKAAIVLAMAGKLEEGKTKLREAQDLFASYKAYFKDADERIRQAKSKIEEGGPGWTELQRAQNMFEELRFEDALVQANLALRLAAEETVRKAEGTMKEGDKGRDDLQKAVTSLERSDFVGALDSARAALQGLLETRRGAIPQPLVDLLAIKERPYRSVLMLGAMIGERPRITIYCLTPEKYRYLGEELLFRASLSPEQAGCTYRWTFNGETLQSDQPDQRYTFPIKAIGGTAPVEHTIEVKALVNNKEVAANTRKLPLKLPEFCIRCLDREEDQVAGVPLNFIVVRVSQLSDQQPSEQRFNFKWSVPSGTLATPQTPDNCPAMQYIFKRSGSYPISVRLELKGSNPQASEESTKTISTTFTVRESRVQRAEREYQRGQHLATWMVFLIASLSGLIYIEFFRTTFGTLQDYIQAFLWGAGLDVARRGFPQAVVPVFQRIADAFKGKGGGVTPAGGSAEAKS